MFSLKTENLNKIYKSSFKKREVHALKDFSLTVDKGEIFGLLGPNGAGKTTLVKVLLGITFPTSGDAEVLGCDISDYKIKRKIGYLPENHKYPNYLNATQVLDYFGKLSGIADSKSLKKSIDKHLEIVGLLKWKNVKIRKYSKGMLQRLGLAQSIMNDPDLIFLDEPTDGVDPIGRKEIRDLLSYLKSQGKTIFLNSHLLSEVELICDRIAILNQGKLLKIGHINDLLKNELEYIVELSKTNDKASFELLKAIIPNSTINDYTLYFKSNDVFELNSVIDKLRGNKILIESINSEKKTLEDYFIKVIKESEKTGT